MIYIYILLFFILGTLMGSFYAVVGMRLPVGKKIAFDHSRCDYCGHTLALYEMIPIFSYLFQGGRCCHCKEKITPMLPIVELSTGILYAVAYFSFGFSLDLVLALLIVSLFVIVLVSDLSYLIIPDSVLIFFAISFFITQLFRVGLYENILHVLTGIFLFILMYLIMCIGNKMFKNESLGGGDIKMLFVFGLVLDPLLGTLSIFLGSFIALPVSIVLYMIYHDNIIPFGPFLLLSFLFIYFSKMTPETILHILGM